MGGAAFEDADNRGGDSGGGDEGGAASDDGTAFDVDDEDYAQEDGGDVGVGDVGDDDSSPMAATACTPFPRKWATAACSAAYSAPRCPT